VLRYTLSLIVLSGLFVSACSELERPQSEDFFARSTAPRKQELRWSNGRLPKTIDPARAAAAPETDVVRAIYEGLTELDPRTLQEKPAVASEWESSSDNLEWTFQLRPDAKWSNGDPVTADDFLRSWKRAAALEKEAPHGTLFSNIVGFSDKISERPAARPTPSNGNSNSAMMPGPSSGNAGDPPSPTPAKRSEAADGVEVLGPLSLFVKLIEPDRDFPKLVSHPVFRPVHAGQDRSGEVSKPSVNVVTNGPFRIEEAGPGGIELAKSENYWNSSSVRLERVLFVPSDSTEKALEAYRAGDLDAITNTSFSPVLLKLLAPYEDFRRTTFAAINFYEINAERPPFTDRRIRQALSLSIERERLSEGELEGATIPAPTFMPFASSPATGYAQDRQRAADLLDEAGFPNGQNFPVVRLVVNRNDVQQRIARSVAAMWRSTLNIETEIIIKETSEMEAVRESRDFDLIRRGVVLATPDETVNIRAIFGKPLDQGDRPEIKDKSVKLSIPDYNSNANTSLLQPHDMPDIVLLTSHEQALFELRAIPLYFPSSYSLVKPYVVGFEPNSFDAHSLLDTYIDESWQPDSRK
jgi:oligopeptide transport system substrate-binding protein